MIKLMRTSDCHRLEANREAHALAELGFHVVPIEFGGKRPLIAWKDAESSHCAIDEWFDRFGSPLNIAIVAGKSGIVGLDADRPEAAAWITSHCPPTPMVATTPRGGLHAYFRAPADVPPPAQNLFGIGLDVRSRASLLIASPSWSQEHGRRWAWKGCVMPPSELPVIASDLIRRERSPEPYFADSGRVERNRASGPIRDVTRWIMEVESIQGMGGSNQCFKVACRLVDAGLSWHEAWRWLGLWNITNAKPAWSEQELRQKLMDAFERHRINA